MSSRRVSVLLPTYNRAAFLPAAFDAIRGQALGEWELIVVDDGSTDDTERVVSDFVRTSPQPVRYIKQANAGPYAARNRALDFASAPYVAFYDSDDLWLAHHLSRSVAALDEAPDVDWVYAACRMIDHDTGAVIAPDTFQVNGRARPFTELRTRPLGALRVFDDARVVECAVRNGLYCGLQNSVIRSTVFASERFRTSYRNEAEDQLFLIRALKNGHRVGYFDDVHVEYRVHAANSSASAKDRDVNRLLGVYRALAQGYEDMAAEFTWRPAERRALAQRLSREYFWHIGYAVLWQDGRREEALRAFRTGLQAWPWSVSCWKTYLLSRLRTWMPT